MELLSIIVPVHQVEKYLKKCIDSILYQSYRKFELIIIDDGSYDNSTLICDEKAIIDSRTIVLHKKNNGVSSARNNGIDLSTGKWLSFVDSDDYLEKETYKEVFDEIDRTNSQMAIMDFVYVDETGKVIKEQEYGKNEILNQKELVRKQFDIPLTIRCALSNKVVNREVLGELRYDEKLYASEDTLLLSKLLYKVDKACWLRKPFYRNVQRTNSAMHGGLNDSSLIESLDIHRNIAYEVKRKYPELYDYAIRYYLDTTIWKMNYLINKNENRKKYYINEIKRRIKDEIVNIILNSEMSVKYKIRLIVYGLRGE